MILLQLPYLRRHSTGVKPYQREEKLTMISDNASIDESTGAVDVGT